VNSRTLPRPDYQPLSPAAVANGLGPSNACFDVTGLQATVYGLSADEYVLVDGIVQHENILRMTQCADSKAISPNGLAGARVDRRNTWLIPLLNASWARFRWP
jgi:hypothetical protein